MLIRAANMLAMAAALGLAMASTFSSAGEPPDEDVQAQVQPEVRRVRLADGREALLDAADQPVPLRRYERIVAGSTVADELLLALCEPSRIAGFTIHSAEQAVHRFRFAGVPVHGGVQNVEQMLALRPDLIVTNHIGDGQAIARLRERGIAVFDLGPMRGMSTLPGNIHQVAWLLGDPQRGVDYASSLQRRMAAVARGLAPARRKRALYLSVYGDKLYGGTRGTSYHDVLDAAGLIDVAAARYRDWPAFSSEEVLALDPELIVTAQGMARALCLHPGFDRLRPCARPGAIVELAPHLTQTAGPPMLDAAEQLYARVYAGEER